MVPLVEGARGETLEVGRKKRTVPAALRRAVLAPGQRDVDRGGAAPPLVAPGHPPLPPRLGGRAAPTPPRDFHSGVFTLFPATRQLV